MEKPKQDVIQNLGGSTPLQTQGAGSGRKWSPAPWKYVQEKHGTARYWISSSIVFIASVGNGSDGAESHLRAEANARLIVLAPELFEALHDLFWEVHDLAVGTRCPSLMAAFSNAGVLLARAGGPDPSPVSKHIRTLFEVASNHKTLNNQKGNPIK